MAVVGSAGADDLNTPVVYVEVAEPQATGTGGDWGGESVRAGGAQKVVQTAQDLVGDGVDLARTCAYRFGVGLRELPGGMRAPDEIELQLGITLDAEVGAVLARTSASAQLQLTLRWTGGQ